MIEQETNFNCVHSSTRMATEKNIWCSQREIEQTKICAKHRACSKVVIVACMLHNICFAEGSLEEFYTDTDVDIKEGIDPEINMYPDETARIRKHARIVHDMFDK